MDQAKGITKLFLLLVSLMLAGGCSVLPGAATGAATAGPTSAASAVTSSAVSPPQGSLPGPDGQGAATAPASVPAAQSQPSEGMTVFPEGSSVFRGLLGTIHSLDPQMISLSSEEELSRYTTGSLYLLAGDPVSGQAYPTAYHAAGEPQPAMPVLPGPGEGTGQTAKTQATQGAIPAEPTHFLEFTVKLRPGLTWSDGAPVTARDYVASLEKLLTPGQDRPTALRFTRELVLVKAADYQAGRLGDFSQVGFAALDELTLQLTLARPATGQEVMRHLTLPFLVKAAAPGAADDASELIGAGPYEVENYEPGRSIRLKKRQGTVLDELNAIHFTWDYLDLRAPQTDLAALTDFYAGKLDIVSVAGSAFRGVADDPRLKTADDNTVWGIYVNTTDPGTILADPDFRQALYWGTNRTPLAVGLFGSYSSYSGFIGPQSFVEKNGKTVSWRKTRESQANVASANVWDPVKAKAFADLAMARAGGRQSLELIIPEGDEQMAQMAALLKAEWEELFGGGLLIEISPLELGEAYARYRSGEYELGFGAMGQDLYDPWQSMAVFASDHPLKLDTMASEAFDAMAAQAGLEEIRLDAARRLELLQAMEVQLLQELPQIPLFVSHQAYLIAEDIQLPFKQAVPGYGLGLDMAVRRE